MSPRSRPPRGLALWALFFSVACGRHQGESPAPVYRVNELPPWEPPAQEEDVSDFADLPGEWVPEQEEEPELAAEPEPEEESEGSTAPKDDGDNGDDGVRGTSEDKGR